MKRLIVMLLSGLFFCTPFSAHALFYEFDTVLTGATPGGPAPWLTAEFTNSSQNVAGVVTSGVLLKLRAPNLMTSPATEFVTNWYFNNTLEDIIHNLKFATALTGTALANKNYYPVDINDLNAGGGARFDIYFQFQTSNKNSGRFERGDLADIFLYGVEGLTAESFNTLSTSNNEGKKYFAEAHIQGISSGDGSAWVIPGPETPVPEPGTYVLLGGGLLGLAIYNRRRRSKND